MDLFKKIKTGTTILTPNRRLSALFAKKYVDWQLAQGLSTWATLDIIPLYPSWLDRLWKTYQAATIDEEYTLLTSQQEQILWEKILRNIPECESLLQLTETAKLAKSAWEKLKRWRVKLDNPDLCSTEDSRAFLKWATHFATHCRENFWLDPNSLADMLSEKISDGTIIPPSHIILVGFTEIAPQYQYLLNICDRLGSSIETMQTLNRNLTTYQIGLTDTKTEIRNMALWANDCLAKSESIGCIIPNLEKSRDQVQQLFSEIIEDGKYNISAGKSLIAYPIIHDAIQLLNLNNENLDLKEFSIVLRSPFLGDAEKERNQRALLENRLRNNNVTTLNLLELISADSNINNTCPLLFARIKKFLEKAAEYKKEFYPSQWSENFISMLQAWGWPGERSLNSEEYQIVQNAWLPALAEFGTFDGVLGKLRYSSALHYLTCLIQNIVFQPESPSAPIQILGLLEAAEIPFEHAWIMGLDDTTWPARPKPNPFIPLRLQKALSMPNASAERELEYCLKLTEQLQQSSQHVIFSYPEQKDDIELAPSLLLKNFDSLTIEELNLSQTLAPAEMIFHSQQIEAFSDSRAPAISVAEEISGGVRIFKSQAECPFKAFAEIRLHARKIEDTTIGLRKLDRGNLLHKGLELIWKELKTSSELHKKSEVELDKLTNTAAINALKEILEVEINTRYLKLEQNRLKDILKNWLIHEKSREPFIVQAIESEINAKIGNINATFRVDRIDELVLEDEAKHLIIDYKTGKDIDKNNWFGPRLSEPQLPIYCITHPDKTIGIAFAKVNNIKMELAGTSMHSLNTKTIVPLMDLKQADAVSWSEQIQIWQANLERISEEFAQGNAAVDPKYPNKTCDNCNLHALCRIHELNKIEVDYENTE